MTEKADVERLRALVNQDLFREAPKQPSPRIDLRESFVRWVEPEETPADPILRDWISEFVHG